MNTLRVILSWGLFSLIASVQVAAASPLSEKEKAGLQLMREEEKLAHDVYSVLFEKWQLRPFSNISQSETRHFEAVGYLLETYKLEDPAYNQPGKFRNNELAELYDSLVARGSESLLAALEVGAFIEEVDIKDLQELLDTKPEKQIAEVYENLLWGSKNHLRAFTRNLSVRDQKYAPKVLSAANYSEIVGTGQQAGCGKRNRCGGSCKNR